jgi:hypothetical protein
MFKKKLPQATKLPDGAYAQVMTQLERSGIAWIYTRKTITTALLATEQTNENLVSRVGIPHN